MTFPQIEITVKQEPNDEQVETFLFVATPKFNDDTIKQELQAQESSKANLEPSQDVTAGSRAAATIQGNRFARYVRPSS